MGNACPMVRPILACLALFCAEVLAGDAREDWARVTALDSGPGETPKNSADAAKLILSHVDRQEQALRAFLATHPADVNMFEARLRLARLLDLRAGLKEEPEPIEAANLLKAAERDAITPARRTELDFALLSHRMRNWQGKRPTAGDRRAILDQARAFERAHPGDRRVPSLLAEVATLFDGEPKTKEALLLGARKGALDPVVKAQIDDDLKRLGFLGKPLPLRFVALDGRRIDLNEWRGDVVVIAFFSTWSEPSKAGLRELLLAVGKAGAGARFVAVSLDTERAALEAFVRSQKAKFPVAWDGKGWNGPLIQTLGINALPTTWLLDRSGVVRSLDALEAPEDQLRLLLDSR